MLIMNHFTISFSKILSYVPCIMLRIVSKLVKSTAWVLLRSWVDIGFDNWFWCTDSCTNWFALAIFRHIQAKNHNLQFRKMCFIVNLFSALIPRYFHEIFAKKAWELISVISTLCAVYCVLYQWCWNCMHHFIRQININFKYQKGWFDWIFATKS